MSNLYKDRDWLEDQYINMRKSAPQIAKENDRGRSTIYSWLKKFNIKIRSKSDALKGRKLSDEHKRKVSESKKGKYIGKNKTILSMEKRIKAIVGINETIRQQLLGDYKPILERGIEEGLSFEEISNELAVVVRNKFNNARARAKTIARTEINGAMNQAREDTMIESGIKEHEWTSSLDSDVRETHKVLDGQIRKIGKPFSNGLLYPHDPAGKASEVINCRCIAIAVIGE